MMNRIKAYVWVEKTAILGEVRTTVTQDSRFNDRHGKVLSALLTLLNQYHLPPSNEDAVFDVVFEFEFLRILN